MLELRSIARQMPIKVRDKCRCIDPSANETRPAAPVVGPPLPQGIRPPSRSVEPPVILRGKSYAKSCGHKDFEKLAAAAEPPRAAGTPRARASTRATSRRTGGSSRSS